MRIVITGAAGMLGRDTVRVARGAGHEVLALARGQLDIGDGAAVTAALAAARPDVVINCAAWTDVDGAQTHASDAMALNGEAAGHLAAAANASGAWIVQVSSDYVFDGTKRSPYVESDRVGPLSAYGQSKLAGEQAVAAAAPDGHTIVRSSWLFGAEGHCFPRTIMRLAGERGELDVVDDQVGCPTYTGHLAQALMALAAQGPAGLLHVAATGTCSWWEFASEIVALSGAAATVRPIGTDRFPRPAPRPAYSVLASERGAPALPHWREGLRAFMAEAGCSAEVTA
jgi:dTDP-4-dehydrorhamnose reductase